MISTRWPAWASLTSSNPFLAFRWVQHTVSLFFVVLVVIILMRMMVAIMTCDCDDWWWWLCYWFIIYVIIIIIFNNILPVFKVAEEESSRGRTKLSCNARRSNLLPLLLITFGVGVEYSVITFQQLKAAKIYWWLTINQAKEHLLKRMFGMPAFSEEHCISVRAHIILDDKKKLWFFATKTSQELRMLSRSLSNCKSLLPNLDLNLSRCLCLCSDCSDCSDWSDCSDYSDFTLLCSALIVSWHRQTDQGTDNVSYWAVLDS